MIAYFTFSNGSGQLFIGMMQIASVMMQNIHYGVLPLSRKISASFAGVEKILLRALHRSAPGSASTGTHSHRDMACGGRPYGPTANLGPAHHALPNAWRRGVALQAQAPAPTIQRALHRSAPGSAFTGTHSHRDMACGGRPYGPTAEPGPAHHALPNAWRRGVIFNRSCRSVPGCARTGGRVSKMISSGGRATTRLQPSGLIGGLGAHLLVLRAQICRDQRV